jgi:hypothetical protein
MTLQIFKNAGEPLLVIPAVDACSPTQFAFNAFKIKILNPGQGTVDRVWQAGYIIC